MAKIEITDIGYYSVTVRLIELQDVNYKRRIYWSYAEYVTGAEKTEAGHTDVEAHASASDEYLINALNPATKYTILASVWKLDDNNDPVEIVNDDLLIEVTTADPDAPPENVKISDITATSAKITLSGTDSAWDGYELNIWFDKLSKYCDREWKYSNPYTVTVTNLTPNTLYKVEVTFFNVDTEKEIYFGEPVSFTTLASEPFAFSYKGAKLVDGALIPVSGSAKDGSLYFFLTASEWNALCGRINAARTMKGKGEYAFTEVSAGDEVRASIYNEAAEALAFYRQLTAAAPNGDISAALLNALMDTVNEILQQ